MAYALISIQITVICTVVNYSNSPLLHLDFHLIAFPSASQYCKAGVSYNDNYRLNYSNYTIHFFAVLYDTCANRIEVVQIIGAL
jgi:hypothetical protein